MDGWKRYVDEQKRIELREKYGNCFDRYLNVGNGDSNGNGE